VTLATTLFEMSGLSLETCPSHLKSVALTVLKLLAFNAQKFRGQMTLDTPPFRKFLRGHVRTVPGNIHVKFEVRSFNRFRDISINAQKFRGTRDPDPGNGREEGRWLEKGEGKGNLTHSSFANLTALQIWYAGGHAQPATSPHFWATTKSKMAENRNNSAAIWDIVTKFRTLVDMDSPQRAVTSFLTHKISKMADGLCNAGTSN